MYLHKVYEAVVRDEEAALRATLAGTGPDAPVSFSLFLQVWKTKCHHIMHAEHLRPLATT